MKKQKKYRMFRFLIFIIKPFYFLLLKPKVLNKQLVPKVGPIIVCGNHDHAFDQFNVMLSTKRLIHYMAKKEYFDGEHSLFGDPSKIGNAISKWLVITTGQIRVDRNIKDDVAKGEAVQLLKEGRALGIFPEGTRNKTDAFLLPFKFGAVSLAQKTGASIVPFATTGAFKVFKKNHLNTRFGEPFKVSKDMTLDEANEKLYNIITDLKRQGLEDIKNGKY